jgi:hypothetical protein
LPVWQLAPDTPLEVHLTIENNGDLVELALGQDLIITLPDTVDWKSEKKIESNPEVLVCSGVRWNSGKKTGTAFKQLDFWTFKAGETSLKIEYQRETSSEVETFSIQVKVCA